MRFKQMSKQMERLFLEKKNERIQNSFQEQIQNEQKEI